MVTLDTKKLFRVTHNMAKRALLKVLSETSQGEEIGAKLDAAFEELREELDAAFEELWAMYRRD
jgi:hypothetical protein